MISYLSGKIISKKEKFIVLDVHDVGYKVFLSQAALTKVPEIGQNLKLSCFLVVRENILDLYGFLSSGELELFEIVNNISGIGPKAALEISILGPLEKIKERILAQDENLFTGIPGVGKKKAMTIILELSGKIKEGMLVGSKKKDTKYDEAEEALINLGFPRQKAREALDRIPKNIATEQRVQEALKILGKH